MKDDAALELVHSAEKYLVPKLKDEAEKNLVRNIALNKDLLEHAKSIINCTPKDLEDIVVKAVTKILDDFKGKDLAQLPSSVIEKILQAQNKYEKK